MGKKAATTSTKKPAAAAPPVDPSPVPTEAGPPGAPVGKPGLAPLNVDDLPIPPADDGLFARVVPRLAVSPHAIETALLEQPVMVYDVSAALTVWKNRREVASHELKRIAAAADGRAREAITAEGGKPTEKSVDAYIMTDPAVVEATAKLGRAEAAVRSHDDLLQAVHSRGYTLRELVKIRAFELSGNSIGTLGPDYHPDRPPNA